jgi:hypothetical protein
VRDNNIENEYTLLIIQKKFIISDGKHFTAEFEIDETLKYIPWIQIYKKGSVQVKGSCEESKDD